MRIPHLVTAIAAAAVLFTAAAADQASAQSYCPPNAKAGFAVVQMWNGANCTGGSIIVPGGGDLQRPNFAAIPNFDGRIYNIDNSRSSLAVAPNYCVKVFDGPNYTGQESNALCSGAGVVYYGLFEFNDRVSSMRVCPRDQMIVCMRPGATVPPPPPPPPPPPMPRGGVDPLMTDPARRCTGGPQPGALRLRDWLAANYPGGRNVGIYNCRPVRGGRNLSLHGEGRAVDWGVNRATGDQIVGRLRANEWELARRMGLQEIIWNRQIWTADRSSAGLRRYSGANPHTDHVHLGMNNRGARAQTSFWVGM
jgi:hypothetical protein